MSFDVWEENVLVGIEGGGGGRSAHPRRALADGEGARPLRPPPPTLARRRTPLRIGAPASPGYLPISRWGRYLSC